MDFWQAKIQKTRERDSRSEKQLRRDGWEVLTVWECETKNQNKNHRSEGANTPPRENYPPPSGGLSVKGLSLHRDALDDIAGDPPASAVIELGRLGIGVPSQVLHVLHGHVLAQQIGDHHHPETVRGNDLGQPCLLEPPLEHPAHPVRRHGSIEEPQPPPVRR